MRASDTSEVLFDDCRVAGDQLLGEEGQGFVDTMQVLDAGRIGIAALSVGLAQGAYEAALRYAQERRAFGKTISAFQAIQWKLADNATRIEAARLLTYRAAYLKDQGQRTTLESSMAKLYASEIAVRAGRRLRADSRRLRLRQGLSGGEVLPRRQAHDDRRRHERDSAPGHRAAAARSDGPLTSLAERVLGGDAARHRARDLAGRGRGRRGRRARPRASSRRPGAPISSASPVRPAPARARSSIG